ncbi:MAG: histidine triad nucleotide-binding protein [Gammaproteobacteria bacterium 39-13]|nr:histidine triad nucleotide-binding protein [Gammaproteobacteria bacterium]OJV96172.1 MAG: histidine triad nucleotide-binding protein [Gammaproteobacteria bacterium 39-13]
MSKTIFEKIIDRELPANIIYEDEHCIAFHDNSPQAPIHVLLVTKKVIPKLADASPEDATLLGYLMTKVSEITKTLGIQDNFRLVINNGSQACQTVFHLHVHIMGGRNFHWPPG